MGDAISTDLHEKVRVLKSITTHSILFQNPSSLFAGIASKPLHRYLAFSWRVSVS